MFRASGAGPGSLGRARPSLSCGVVPGAGLPAPVVRLRPPGWGAGPVGPLVLPPGDPAGRNLCDDRAPTSGDGPALAAPG